MNNKNIITKSGNVTYYVNREKKTVVAVIKCGVEKPAGIFEGVSKKFQNANGKKNVLDVRSDYFHNQNIYVNDHYVGIAKCHESDTFNEEFGKKLALARANEKKAYDIKNNFYKFVDQLDDLNYMVGKKSDELYLRWINYQEEITKLLQSIAKR